MHQCVKRQLLKKWRYFTMCIVLMLAACGCMNKNAGENESQVDITSATPDDSELSTEDEVVASDDIDAAPDGGSEIEWDCVDLNEGDQQAFVDDFMGEGTFSRKPDYTYYDEENGAVQLELYYDLDRDKGCGIRYRRYRSNPEVDEYDVSIYGFSFRGHYTEPLESEAVMYADFDWESLLEEAKQDEGITISEENQEYDEQGRLIFREVLGHIDWLGESDSLETILSEEYQYREDGTLAKKIFVHSSFIWGTSRCSYTRYFDDRERLMYERSYITHGHYDSYFIYEDEDDKPDYVLHLDFSHGYVPVFCVIEEKNTRPKHDSRLLTEAGKEEFIDGFLGEGYSQQEPDYVYDGENGNMLKVELYYDQENDRGCGVCSNGLEMYGFTFEGHYIRTWGYTDIDTPFFEDESEWEMWGYDTVLYEEYDDLGRVVHRERVLDDPPENSYQVALISIDYKYNADGTMEKSVLYSAQVFGTSRPSYVVYYDENGRPLFEDNFETYGNFGSYYIYGEDDEKPEYLLTLEYFEGQEVVAILYVYM